MNRHDRRRFRRRKVIEPQNVLVKRRHMFAGKKVTVSYGGEYHSAVVDSVNVELQDGRKVTVGPLAIVPE